MLNRMSPGGAEMWLMHVLRLIDRERYTMDFLVQAPGRFDEEIKALGSKVIICGGHRKPWVFAKNMRAALREHGPYDVIHSHVHHYSGIVLANAKLAGVPVRVAHSHNDLNSDSAEESLVRRAYLRFTEGLIQWAATSGIACSRPAAASLFGEGWERDERWEVMPCGIDLRPFQTARVDTDTRGALGIPDDALVMGHVGSFTRQKNHAFLVEIARAVTAREDRAHLLLVGDGPLRPDVEAAVREAGITDRVTFAGLRDDVPALMRDVIDVFVFPSLFEGSPLVLVETQAAGLPAVISDTITDEIVLSNRLVTRASLQDAPEIWADRVLGVAPNEDAQQRGTEGLEAVRDTVYDSSKNVEILGVHYQAA